ncbi:MAG: copper chaperone PCu(A)C [Rhodospirillaceae bacterium]
MRRAVLLLAALLVVSNPASGDDFRAYDIEIIFPWTRATTPGQDISQVYMKLSNTGDYADRLVRASSPMAKHVQLNPRTNLVIPPGETVMLAPDGPQLTLTGLTALLVEGQSLPFTLTFERGGTVDVSALITNADAMAPPSE